MNKLEESVQRCHVHLYSRDLERIEILFGGRISRAEAVRELIRQMLDRIEAKGKRNARPLDTDLEEVLEIT